MLYLALTFAAGVLGGIVIDRICLRAPALSKEQAATIIGGIFAASKQKEQD